MWYVTLTCLLCRFSQAALKLAGREVFQGLRVQDVTEFNFDWCSVFCLLGEKEKKEKRPGGFSPRAGHALLAVPCRIFTLGAIKGWFKGQSLNFMCTLCVGSYLVCYKESESPKCNCYISMLFLKLQSLGILISFPICHLGSSLHNNFCSWKSLLSNYPC
jgi:hypothetical protein